MPGPSAHIPEQEHLMLIREASYCHEGEHFRVPPNHNILPKPLGGTHPPLRVACGNLSTFEVAASMGIGAIAFNFEPAFVLKGSEYLV